MKPGLRLSACLLLCCLALDTSAATLPRTVSKALKQAHIPLNSVGIEVRELHARKPLISLNAARAMSPASTMKLLTTFAGLELLGPSHTWKTEAWLDGSLENGVLAGNLVLKGDGDPKFTLEQFWLWLRELRGRGLREIRGDVILDRSAFQLAPYDPAAFDNDPLRAYNVGPDALLLNFNVMRLLFIPERDGIRTLVEPELAGLSVDNRLRPSARNNCGDWDEAVFPQLDGATLLLQGEFPVACGERAEQISLLPHAEFMEGVFRTLWRELGGTFDGKLRDGILPANATLFAIHQSQPLSELIRDINKFSNNVMARQLFLSLAPDTPASIARSEQAVHDWLARKRLKFPELVLENGAGLSRTERISPRSMTRLLLAAQRSSMQPEFEASLPIIGVDGTLRKRLRGNGATGHAHLKTGSLEGVKTLAGYVQSRSGKQWAVVFFINHPNAAAGQRAQDALIEWVQKR